MQPGKRSLCWVWMLTGVAAAGLTAGCATSGRRILLKEYGPTGPVSASQPLKGAVVCIKGFQCAATLTSPDPTTKAEQPLQFKFVEFTKEQKEQWEQEFLAMEKAKAESTWREIGSVRNGFGMVMSHVYAMNDPGAWLTETLKLDLENQGAKVVDASQADSADICVSGTVQFCRVDIYMKIWGDLVVDLELQPKNCTGSHKLLHTDGGILAWVGSTGEFYKPLRECRQKFSWLTSREITAALNR